MKTLHLNLKKKWFDMILSGEKTEEYREIKPFYLRRLTELWREYECSEGLTEDIALEICHEIVKHKEHNLVFQRFDTVTFSNGYAKNRPQFEIELKSIKIKTGSHEWGAEQGKLYFVLILGAIYPQ